MATIYGITDSERRLLKKILAGVKTLEGSPLDRGVKVVQEETPEPETSARIIDDE